MNIRYIIISTLLSITTLSWSQEDFKVIFDDEPLEARKEPLEVRKDTILANKPTDITLDTIRSLIIDKAHEFIGVNYRYGKSDENGFDCSGFVKFVYGGFGYVLPHSSAEQYMKSTHIKARNAQPGDLVFFKTRGSVVSHVGIYLGENRFIHSPSKGKKVSINTIEEQYYKTHLVGFGSFLL